MVLADWLQVASKRSHWLIPFSNKHHFENYFQEHQKFLTRLTGKPKIIRSPTQYDRWVISPPTHYRRQVIFDYTRCNQFHLTGIRLNLENIAQLDQSYEEEKPQTDEMYWDCEPSFLQSGDPFQYPLASRRSCRLERVEDRGSYHLNRLDVLIRLHLLVCPNMDFKCGKFWVKVENSGKTILTRLKIGKCTSVELHIQFLTSAIHH